MLTESKFLIKIQTQKLELPDNRYRGNICRVELRKMHALFWILRIQISADRPTFEYY